MLLTFIAILAVILGLIRPLQKNPFFLLYFGLVVGAAALTEQYFFRTTPFVFKTFLLFIPYHLAMINLVTFLAYGADKRAAVRGQWRIPEMQLHTLEFLGGWPAAFLGQTVFRHKTKKKSFRAVFWLMIILELCAVWYILSFLHLI